MIRPILHKESVKPISKKNLGDPIHSGENYMSYTAPALLIWCVLMFFVPQLVGIKWFTQADFSWREAMILHGIFISAWMLLMLGALQSMKPLKHRIDGRWVSFGAVCSPLLTGIGGLLGTGAGTVIQIAGMFLADITALLCLFWMGRDALRIHNPDEHIIARWGLLFALVAISLATPLGHLAGAYRDIKATLPFFQAQTATVGTDIHALVERFAGSHSHEAIASFLGAMVLMAVLQTAARGGKWMKRLERVGCMLILLATMAQVAIYQYGAWTGWEPPTLFASGENGIPLDDLILSFLGIGMLILCPLLWKPSRKEGDGSLKRWRGIAFVILIVSFAVAIIGLGIFIEFNEDFFGHGEGGALGVINAQNYIRGHLVYGFVMIPMLFVSLLTLPELPDTPLSTVVVFGVIGVTILGALGLAEWTFMLQPSLLTKASVAWGFIVVLIGYLHLRNTGFPKKVTP